MGQMALGLTSAVADQSRAVVSLLVRNHHAEERSYPHNSLYSIFRSPVAGT
jgi:hypothetical protein